MRAKAIIFIVISLLLAGAAFSQSRETGAIRGVVTDDQNAPLPGVSVTLTSGNLMGSRSQVTDAKGEFRFPALPPGDYKVKAELAGFGTFVRESIRLTTTATLDVDIQLKPSKVSEEITVVAQTPTVDVKSTETASVTLSNEILRNVPNSQFTSSIVNLAPGVTGNVAFGASESTGIAYSMDGVNVADPEAGSAWVFSDYNIIEEAKVMGIGLPAEYGNFTGVIFNLVTKSGGNNFSGHFEFDFQGYQEDSKFWQANNNGAYVADFPELTSPSSKLMDVNGHLGGPIIKDKLWFYLGAQFYRTQNRPAGFPEDVDYKQPRFFVKVSSQLTPSLNMSLAFQRTKYQDLAAGPVENFIAGSHGLKFGAEVERSMARSRYGYAGTGGPLGNNIKHPYMTQFTVGIERELFKNTSLGLTYINRKWNNLVGKYDSLGVYEPTTAYSPELDETFTVYERTLETYSTLITNLRMSADLPNILENPYRKYEGFEVLFNKRFSNRWQLLASYVYGKATGTVDNAFGEDIGAAWAAGGPAPLF